MNDSPKEYSFETAFSPPAGVEFRSFEPGHTYDVLVLGAGPAGISASIYLLRKGLDIGIVSGNVGGQVTWTASIENYLGYRLIEGVQLVEKFNEQLREFSVTLGLDENVTGCSPAEGSFEVKTAASAYRAGALVIATGKRPRVLGVPGEKRLLGRGVAYCAICDAPLYRGKTTSVVGGGNSGLEAAIDLARGCPKVYLVERGDTLTGDGVLVEKVRALGNVEVILGAEVEEILGDDSVKALRLKGAEGAAPRELAVEGVFVETGLVPNSEAFRGFVPLNEWGEIEVDCQCRTAVPGVFAAGDVTAVPYKQIVIAAGEGAKAALSASDYLLRRPNDEVT